MAKINVKNPCYKTHGEKPKKGKLGKAITIDINIETNEAYLYANGVITESDKTWKSLTMSLETSDISYQNQSDLLGHELKPEGKKGIRSNIKDIAPYTGFGFNGENKVNNVISYRAVWLEKLMFGEPNDSNATRGENVEFKTHNIEAKGMADEEGYWKDEETFDTEEEAIAWLDAKMNETVEVEGA